MTSNSPIRLGYKASAEQFGPRSCCRSRCWPSGSASTTSPCPTTSSRGATRAATPGRPAVARRAGRAQRARPHGHERADADVPLPPGRDRAGVRDARLPVPGSRLPRRRHGRVAEREPVAAGEWPGVKERRMRLAEAIELIRQLWTRGARRLRGRVLHDAQGDDLRPPRRAGADLHRRVGPLAAKLAGRVGDGFICTSGKDPELYADAARRASPRAPRRPGATPSRSRA